MKREEALKLVREHTKNENLVRHMLATEACMRALYDRIVGKEDKEQSSQDEWGMAGLLHDADYEELKDSPQVRTLHTKKTLEWLDGKGLEKKVLDAIKAHAWGYVDGMPEPKTPMEWALYTCDELTGLIVAVALVKGGRLSEVTVDSIMKKWNESSFAAGANREQIAMCEERLEIPLRDFVEICLKAMQEISEDLGL